MGAVEPNECHALRIPEIAGIPQARALECHPMIHVTRHERELIETELGPIDPASERDVVVFLAPDTPDYQLVAEIAVWPALAAAGLPMASHSPAFQSDSKLADVARSIRGAELLIADLTASNPDVLYAVGLCHGLGRWPLLINQNVRDLPFHLQSLRSIEYRYTNEGLWNLRQSLSRAIRVFLAAAAASREHDGH
jgi:hypothetical protein